MSAATERSALPPDLARLLAEKDAEIAALREVIRAARAEAWREAVEIIRTLRDCFAAAALQGMLANAQPGDGTPEEFAADAYTFADAMLAARKKEPGA